MAKLLLNKAFYVLIIFQWLEWWPSMLFLLQFIVK